MVTLASPATQRVILRDVSWDLYERILAANESNSAPRFTYDRGTLEIMSPGRDHEGDNRALSIFLWLVATEQNIDFDDVGSMTYKRPQLERGFEADSTFYLRDAERGVLPDEIDVEERPPDLVIEIDLSRSSIPKLELYAALGVLEVWIWDDREARFYVLREGVYEAVDRSPFVPALTPEIVTRFVMLNRQVGNVEWYRSVQTWLRTI